MGTLRCPWLGPWLLPHGVVLPLGFSRNYLYVEAPRGCMENLQTDLPMNISMCVLNT